MSNIKSIEEIINGALTNGELECDALDIPSNKAEAIISGIEEGLIKQLKAREATLVEEAVLEFIDEVKPKNKGAVMLKEYYKVVAKKKYLTLKKGER